MSERSKHAGFRVLCAAAADKAVMEKYANLCDEGDEDRANESLQGMKCLIMFNFERLSEIQKNMKLFSDGFQLCRSHC